MATYDEYEFIKEKSKSTEHVCFLSAVGRRIEYGNNNIDGADIFGVSDGFQDIRSFELSKGQVF